MYYYDVQLFDDVILYNNNTILFYYNNNNYNYIIDRLINACLYNIIILNVIWVIIL